VEKLLTAKELSSFLNVHRKTIYKWAAEGRLPHRKINGSIRFEKEEIKAAQQKYIPIEIYHPGPIPKLDISLADYDKKYLKGDSAVANKKQRWDFGKKGVFKRRLKSGFSWCFWYYDQENKLKKVTAPNATSREDAIVAMEAKIKESFIQQYGSKQITFRKLSSLYLNKYAKQKKESWKTDEKYINNRLLPYFGDMLISQISPEDVSDFVAQFKPTKKGFEEIKGSTINKHLQVLGRMINIAGKFGYTVEMNPVSRELHFAKESKYRRKRILTVDEEQRLMKEASQHLVPIIYCALLQAMRLKEILRLKTSEVDLDAGTITILPENNKTGKLDVIPIRSKMRSIFQQLIAENNGRSPFVFNYEDPGTGKLRPIKTCQHSFEGARRRAKIKGLEFRDLRRTCATRLHEVDVDPLIVSRLLRHSSAKISAEVYIQSNLKLMQKVLVKADEKANFPDVLEHLKFEASSRKTEKEVTCLFLMN